MKDEEIIKLIKDNTALGECTSQMMTVGNIKVIIKKALEQMNSSNDIQIVSDQRELLKAFKDKLTPALEIDVGFDYITNEDIEDCLKEFNSR